MELCFSSDLGPEERQVKTMHEWALAQAVTLKVKEIRKNEGLVKVERLIVGLGELQQIDEEIFKAGLNTCLKSQEKGEVTTVLKKMPAVFICRHCQHQWRMDTAGLSKTEAEMIHFIPEVSRSYIFCPVCESQDFEVSQGRGVEIISLEGVKK